jgi:opacity protein-like surface antigen
MRKAILGAVSALAFASPAVAADLPVTPQVPSYERHTYEYPTAPPVVLDICEDDHAAALVRRCSSIVSKVSPDPASTADFPL